MQATGMVAKAKGVEMNDTAPTEMEIDFPICFHLFPTSPLKKVLVVWWWRRRGESI